MDDIRKFERENTVSAEKQVSELIIRSENEGSPRILFVGNSITLHGVKPEIGWHGLWGMAASAWEKDYVHQTVRMAREIAPDAGYMIVQAAHWERGFWRGEDVLSDCQLARDYNPDILVIRIGENILEKDMEGRDLTNAFGEMIDFFNPTGKAKLILTNLFWPNPAKDACVKEVAIRKRAAFVDINALGTQDEMKALGLFEHSGVAAHPGDLGMLRIAEAIFGVMEPMLKGE